MSTSFSNSPSALRVEVRPSNYLRAAIIAITALACAAILYAALSRWQQIACMGIAWGYAYWLWRSCFALQGVLQWRGTWSWQYRGDNEHSVRLRHCTLWPGLIVLSFRDTARRKNLTLVLAPDSLDQNSARLLRVHLLHFPVFDDAPAAE